MSANEEDVDFAAALSDHEREPQLHVADALPRPGAEPTVYGARHKRSQPQHDKLTEFMRLSKDNKKLKVDNVALKRSYDYIAHAEDGIALPGYDNLALASSSSARGKIKRIRNLGVLLFVH